MASASDPEKKSLRNIHVAVLAMCLVLLLGATLITKAISGDFSRDKDASAVPSEQLDPTELVVDGKDAETGLIATEGYITVKQFCTGCHSAKLITQNHLTREKWESTIRWMQKNQNLGNLGENEPVILDYLSQNYGPLKQGRRKLLEQPVWYELK